MPERSSPLRRRFPDADEVVCDWPHRYLAGTRIGAQTVVCVLTHDLKFDVPVLRGGPPLAGSLRGGDG